jgi:hypothetical protein
MQLNSRIAEGANITPVRYLLTGLCATGFSDLDARRRTLVPAHAARAHHCGRGGEGAGSNLRVEGD